jgi:hypothetical protein
VTNPTVPATPADRAGKGKQPCTPTISDIPSQLEQLRWSRDEERHEVTWIGHRMGWVLLAQSFLMTAAIMSQSNDYPWWHGTVVTLILGCLGIWLAISGGLAVRAAQSVIRAWLQREREICKTNKAFVTLRLNRQLHHKELGETDHLHDVAIRFHTLMMYPLIAAWSLLYIVSVCSGLSRLSDDSTRSQLSQHACIDTGSNNTEKNFLTLTIAGGLITAAGFLYIGLRDARLIQIGEVLLLKPTEEGMQDGNSTRNADEKKTTENDQSQEQIN